MTNRVILSDLLVVFIIELLDGDVGPGVGIRSSNDLSDTLREHHSLLVAVEIAEFNGFLDQGAESVVRILASG